ncbi:hypothetical protein D030_3177B, partial [Vibrio parahaemolyticus AQ3810]
TGNRTSAAIFYNITHNFCTRRLANDAHVDVLTTFHQCFYDANGTVNERTFLIRSDQKANRAFVIWVLGNKAFNGHYHRRQRAFHIGRTTTMKVAIDDGWLERWCIPLF